MGVPCAPRRCAVSPRCPAPLTVRPRFPYLGVRSSAAHPSNKPQLDSTLLGRTPTGASCSASGFLPKQPRLKLASHSGSGVKGRRVQSKALFFVGRAVRASRTRPAPANQRRDSGSPFGFSPQAALIRCDFPVASRFEIYPIAFSSIRLLPPRAAFQSIASD
jgi:hypothetical protein